MPSNDQPHPSTPTLTVDDEGIAWIEFDDPDRSQNVLAEPVMRRLASVVEQVVEGSALGAIRAMVVVSGKEGGFIAGADVSAIEEIEDPTEGERASRLGQAIFMEVEELGIPTVAAIHGTCLGGGTELALACRYRVGSDSDDTEIGFPEVQLGILPAWGGTTRLPRLIGVRSALDMLLTGKRASASSARRKGILDEVLPAENFRQEVRKFVRARIEGPISTGADRGVLGRLLEDTAPGRALVIRMARKRVLSRTGGHYPAPLKILAVVKESLGKPVEDALALEAAAAAELITSSVCKNLIHVFNLRQAARSRTGVEREVEPGPVEEVGILGAGVMGGGIAQLMAYNEIPVRMKDIDHDAVAGGLRHARSLLDKAVSGKKLSRREADHRMELVSGGLDYSGFGRADLVVEAVVEKMEVKQQVLREAEGRVPEECVLTSNTSSLSLDEMAEALERPERFAGMHFFNPVHKMPLVEVVRASRTSDEAVATVYGLATRLGKVPVVVRKDGPGFLVNRILGPYLNEAGHLLSEGARVKDVDSAAEAFGMPMGPLRLVDEVGIDIARHAGETLHDAFGERMEPAPPLVALGRTDRLGKKGGLGFYRYEDGKEKGVDPEIYDVLGDAVPEERIPFEEREIRARLVLVMISEAARILEEGVVERAGDVDLGMIMGTGFPPFRGGLLRYADQIHPRSLVARMQEYREKLGVRFEPAPLLVRLAREDREFYQELP
ncbi:MAG: 3-hydroxyacyl-CoA dehydrogenase NAD-binding domain-containing protein [Longimicrobiales bacterium]